jgi:hypothetical protein
MLRHCQRVSGIGTAAVTQDRELVHIDVHTSLVPARQLRPRTQANDRDPHKMNDNVAGMGCRRPRERQHARRSGPKPVGRLADEYKWLDVIPWKYREVGPDER